jgi:fructose-bisphosphate aldolase class II
MQHNIPTLRQAVEDARSRKVAVAHFNISNLEGLWAIFHAAQGLDLPVIIGVSEGEREAIGVMQAAALVKSFREEFSWPIYLNADHTYSFEKVKAAIDAGFDSVICDGAALPFDENVAYAKQCVAYARGASEETGRDILIEGELGYIGQSSKILDALPDGVSTDEKYLTKPEDAKRFIEETGIDMLAPAVGNVHGMLKSGVNPPLNVPHVKAIAEAVPTIPLVLHGGSGNSAADIQGAIKNGCGIVHVNTELRVAYSNALRDFLIKNPDETTPYKETIGAAKAMQAVVEEKMKIFNMME